MQVLVSHNYGDATFYVVPSTIDYKDLLFRDSVRLIDGAWLMLRTPNGAAIFNYKTADGGDVTVRFEAFPDEDNAVPFSSVLEYIEDVVGEELRFVSKS